MTYAPEFDFILVNDDLQTAFAEIERAVAGFLAEDAETKA